jgi:hypothetical protein
MTTLHRRLANGRHLHALESPPTGPFEALNKLLAGLPVNHEDTHGAIDALISRGATEETALVVLDYVIRKGKGVAA